MTDTILAELIDRYEKKLKEYDVVKANLDQAQEERDRVAQEEINLSKAILEHIGFDTDNFSGGIYNFPDHILPFLKKVSNS